MPDSLAKHFADAFEAGELLTASETVKANVPFTLRIPATGDYEDSKGNKLPNDALLQLAYPADSTAPADIANVTPAEVALMELVGGAGGDASLPVVTAADPAFDLLTETAAYKRIVKADATYSNAPLGFTTAIDFIWEYHPGDTGVDGFWTIDVFSFSGFVVPTHWINRRNPDGSNQGWALVEGFYAGGTTTAANFAGTPAATFPSGTMYYLEDTQEVVVFDLARQDGYLTADGPTAGTFVVVAQPRAPNAAPWEANHDYTVRELVTANRISDGQLTLFAWDDSAANGGTPTDGTSGATFDATEEGRWIEIGEAALNLEVLQSVEITVRGYVSSVTHASQLVLIDAAGNDYDSSDWVYISDDSATVPNAPGTVLQGSAFSPPVNDFRTIVLRYTGGATRRGLSAIRLQLRAGVPTTGVTSIKTKYFSGIAESWTNWGSEQDVFTYTLTEPFDFVTDPQVESSVAKNALVYPVGNFTALAVNDAGAGADGGVYKLPAVDALQLTLPIKATMNAAEGIWRVRVSGDWAALASQATVLSFIDDTANGVEMGTGLPDDGNEWLDLVFDAANDKWIATSGGDVTLTQVIPTYTLHTEVPANIRLYLIDGTAASAEGLYRKETVGDAPNHIG